MDRKKPRWIGLFVVLLVAIILSAANLFTVIVQVLLLIFAGALFGIFLNGLSRVFSEHTRLSYRGSYFVVIVAFVLFATGGGYYSGSQLAQQAMKFADELRSATQQLTDRLNEAGWGLHITLSDIEQAASSGGRFLPQIVAAAGSLVWVATAGVLIFFVGAYVAYDPQLYETGIAKLVPPAQRGRAEEVLQKLRLTLMRWIFGRLIAMTIIGVATGLGLWLLGVPLPFVLGSLAGMLTFIPNIGPLLAMVPQLLLAFQLSPSTALYVILFNVALQSAESYLITPVIMRYEVTLPPALTISAQVLMAVIAGLIGMMMAAPLAAAIMVLVQVLYIRDTLGDTAPGRLAERNS